MGVIATGQGQGDIFWTFAILLLVLINRSGVASTGKGQADSDAFLHCFFIYVMTHCDVMRYQARGVNQVTFSIACRGLQPCHAPVREFHHAACRE